MIKFKYSFRNLTFKKLINFKKWLRIGGILILNFPGLGQYGHFLLLERWFGFRLILGNKPDAVSVLFVSWSMISALIGIIGWGCFIDSYTRDWFFNDDYDY